MKKEVNIYFRDLLVTKQDDILQAFMSRANIEIWRHERPIFTFEQDMLNRMKEGFQKLTTTSNKINILKVDIFLKDLLKSKQDSLLKTLEATKNDYKWDITPLFTIKRIIPDKVEEKRFFKNLQKVAIEYICYKIVTEKFFSFDDYFPFFQTTLKNKLSVRLKIELRKLGKFDTYRPYDMQVDEFLNKVEFSNFEINYKYKESNKKYTEWFTDHLEFIDKLKDYDLYDLFLERLNKSSIRLEGKRLAVL